MTILKANRFDGVLIPDHMPEVHCDALCYAGAAYVIDCMRVLLATI